MRDLLPSPPRLVSQPATTVEAFESEAPGGGAFNTPPSPTGQETRLNSRLEAYHAQQSSLFPFVSPEPGISLNEHPMDTIATYIQQLLIDDATHPEDAILIQPFLEYKHDVL